MAYNGTSIEWVIIRNYKNISWKPQGMIRNCGVASQSLWPHSYSSQGTAWVVIFIAFAFETRAEPQTLWNYSAHNLWHNLPPEFPKSTKESFTPLIHNGDYWFKRWFHTILIKEMILKTILKYFFRTILRKENTVLKWQLFFSLILTQNTSRRRSRQ